MLYDAAHECEVLFSFSRLHAGERRKKGTKNAACLKVLCMGERDRACSGGSHCVCARACSAKRCEMPIQRQESLEFHSLPYNNLIQTIQNASTTRSINTFRRPQAVGEDSRHSNILYVK